MVIWRFVAEELSVSGRFDAVVADCPLFYTSPNAPSKRDAIGTALLTILAGRWRYAHITALRGDIVDRTLPGMGKAAGLVLPRCVTQAKALHLEGKSQTVAPGVHAVVVLDRAD